MTGPTRVKGFWITCRTPNLLGPGAGRWRFYVGEGELEAHVRQLQISGRLVEGVVYGYTEGTLSGPVVAITEEDHE